MSEAGSVHVSDDGLIDLTGGLLDAPARAAALDHLRACSECERRFLEVYRHAERAGLRAERRSSRPARLPRWVPWGSVAAILLVGLVVAPALLRRAPADGLDEWLRVDSERLLLRSATGGEEGGRFREAVEAYGRHDTRRVVALLDGRPIPEAYEPLNLVLASALVWEGRNAEARALLERLDTLTLPQPARDRGRWLLYVALRRSGRPAEAGEIARELASGSGEFAARARAELARP